MSSALRRVFTGAAAWTVAAVASVVVSMLALSVIGGLGGDVQPPAPMPPFDNDEAIATSSAPDSPPPIAIESPSSTAPSGTQSASRPPPPPTTPAAPTPGPPRQFNTQEGVVTAQCIGQQAYLLSWSPAPGYKVDDVRRGPAPVAKVQFEMFGSRHESVVAVECSTGAPRLTRAF